MGVITYFLLAGIHPISQISCPQYSPQSFYTGYTPFDRDTQQQEMEAIIAGDYAFEPEEYWSNVSDTARSFVTECLTIDPASRPTAEEALAHKWVRGLPYSIIWLLTFFGILALGSLRPTNRTSCLILINKVVPQICCHTSRRHSMPRRHVCSPHPHHIILSYSSPSM